MRSLSVEVEKFLSQISPIELNLNPRVRKEVLKMRRLLREINPKL